MTTAQAGPTSRFAGAMLPADRVKNKRAHLVPLADPALAILEARHRVVGHDLVFSEGHGFSGWPKGERELGRAAQAGALAPA
jgi:hypothetical protein